MKRKIRIIEEIAGVYQQYQPIVGKVYDADYVPRRALRLASALITVNGKKIIVREKEFELIDEGEE